MDLDMSYARRVANVERARSVGRRWRTTLAFVGWSATAAAVVSVIGHWVPLLHPEFLVGALVGSCGMTLALALARFDDARVRGLMAEQFTAEVLKRQRQWRAVHNLSFEDGDIDSIVVTPRNVIVIETKWRHARRQADANRQRQGDIEVTRNRAAKVRRFLCLANKLDVDVVPMLMTWGPGAPHLPTGSQITDGVWEVDGNHPELWAPLFARGAVTPDLASAVMGKLRGYQDLRTVHDRASLPPLRREVWSAFLEGVRSERAERVVRRAALKALRQGSPVSG